MTVTLHPFEPEHLLGFDPQQRQVDDYVQAIETRAPQFMQALTAFAGGRALVVAGVVGIWEGRAYVWALVSRHAGPHMRALTRAAIGVFETVDCRRLELYVDAEWTAAQRWARLLGFERETSTPLRGCLPGDTDALLFARVKQTPGVDTRAAFNEMQRALAALS